MRKINIFVLVVLLSAGVFAGQVYAKKSKAYGASLTIKEATPIADILKSLNKFVGKDVLVQGKIIQECPAGGWFMLKDGPAVIFVNLHPSELAIPQAVGATVAAQGVVKKNGPKAEIIGKGVEIK